MTAAEAHAPATRGAIALTIWRRTGFAPALLLVLLVLNIWLNPVRFAPSNWGTLLGLAAPLIGAALASTPAILGGRGGIDVSVGPLMGFVNAIVVKVLITDPATATGGMRRSGPPHRVAGSQASGNSPSSNTDLRGDSRRASHVLQ